MEDDKELRKERQLLKEYLFGFRYQFPPTRDPKILALMKRFDELTQLLIKAKKEK